MKKCDRTSHDKLQHYNIKTHYNNTTKFLFPLTHHARVTEILIHCLAPYYVQLEKEP